MKLKNSTFVMDKRAIMMGELLFDNVYLIETITITLNDYKRIKKLQTQLSFRQ